MEPNKLDTLFKNKLEGHVEPVSSNAWEAVQNGLQAKKRARRPVLWYAAASIAILLLSTISLYNYYSNSSSNKTAIAKIDLNSHQISLNQGIKNHFSAPKVNSAPTNQPEKASINLKRFNQSTVLKTYNKPPLDKEYQRNTLALPKLASLPIVLHKDDAPTKTASFKKIDSEIMVNINYVAQETSKLNEFKQTTNRIKSLASELNLADLRSAKNELFASALTFEKKHNN